MQANDYSAKNLKGIPMQLLRTSIWALGIVLLILIGLYVHSLNFNGPEWLKDISLNVGTEVLSILLTVWLIDSVFKRNELNERERITNIAISQLRLPLRKHISMLLGMYKGALLSPPANPPLTLRDLFGPNYIAELTFFDFSKPAPILNIQPIDWFNYLHNEVEQFKSSLSLTIEKYAAFLDSETVELLESLMASSLLGLLSQARAVPPIDRQQNFNRQYNLLSGNNISELINQHTDLIEKIVELSNQKLPDDKKICLSAEDWRNDVAPQFGSARL